MAAKKPTMAQAYKAAQKSTAAKPKDKGIVGEGKDVLKAAGNSVKQQGEFVAAVGKGAVKGAGAIVKGAGKVAAKVGKVLATPAGGSMLKAAMPKGSGAPPKSYYDALGDAATSRANKARQATDSKYDKVERKIPKRQQLRRGK